MSRRPRKEAVYLNVYDLSPYNDALAPFGLGFFHTGVEVHGTEYCYGGGGGIIHHRPRAPPAGAAPGQQAAQATPFRVQVRLGEVEATSSEVARVVDSLRGTWLGSEYNLLSRNCNSFADELATKLCGRRIPGWVNRLAGMGAACSCLLPPHMQPSPAGGGSSSSGSGGVGGAGPGGAAAAVGQGRVLGGGGGGGGSRSSSAQQQPVSADEARAKRTAAAERRMAAAAQPPAAPAAAARAAAGDDEAETAPLSGRR